MSPLAQQWRDNGGNPDECVMFGCKDAALYMVAPNPCGPYCRHMHGLASPMCAAHVAKGPFGQPQKIVEAHGD